MIHKLLFTNKLEDKDIAIGIVLAHNVHLTNPLPSLEAKLRFLLEDRQQDKLTETEESFRVESRNMLRNGDYKPTGRGKPASEYLYREVQNGNFPRINTIVDINNFISLKYMVPISIWDLDQAATSQYVFRLGKDDESYIFNESEQRIDLKDLVAGFKVEHYTETPIINPIKDSMKTKITTSTKNVGAAIYFPLKAGSKDYLRHEIIWEFTTLINGVSEGEPEYDII
ncbi:MAG TPA: phenylalanine--tRNA ligase beta subunit-related protein [Balneolales bacterium]|nr:phenylalanine--tRNA ligase beta subunit-related protein [Balneolales bacterium]